MSTRYDLAIVENCLVCKLRKDNFFCALPSAWLEALERVKIATQLPKDTPIFAEGESPRGIYILCQGQVKLSMTDIEGRTLVVGIVEPGDVLGLHAAITGEVHELTAETLQPCQLNFVSRSDFLSFLKGHGDACLHAAQHISKDCHSAVDLIRSIGLSHRMDERLAKFLLRWSTQGHHTNGAIRVNLPMTHEEIAQFIGTSRETDTRLLTKLRQGHIAQIDGRTLLIHNRPAMERLVASF